MKYIITSLAACTAIESIPGIQRQKVVSRNSVPELATYAFEVDDSDMGIAVPDQIALPIKKR